MHAVKLCGRLQVVCTLPASSLCVLPGANLSGVLPPATFSALPDLTILFLGSNPGEVTQALLQGLHWVAGCFADIVRKWSGHLFQCMCHDCMCEYQLSQAGEGV